MKTIVIGDLHGDYRGLRAILRATGAVGEDGARVADTRIIQIGDLIHGGRPELPARSGVDDDRCAIEALLVCDSILLGNHELPLVFPEAGFPAFAGMGRLAEATFRALRDAWHAGRLRAATAHEGWLLTHAGLHHRRRRAAVLPGDAAEVAFRLGLAFSRRVESGQADPLFDAIGPARGGRSDVGGIFWCDWSELAACYDQGPGVSQIVGHTPGIAPTLKARGGDHASPVGTLWCVDVGAALSGFVAALVQDESGTAWRPVVARSAWGRAGACVAGAASRAGGRPGGGATSTRSFRPHCAMAG